MAANDYIRTVNITPLGTSYTWDTPPDWITISRVGNTDEWTITVAPNNGPERDAILTVRHANSTTIDTINVNQSAGAALPDPTATPVPPTATPVPPTATPVPQPTATLAPNPTATPVPQPTATLAPNPTATPAPAPTATPIPLSVAINENGINIGSTTINDYANGPGSTVTVSYSYTITDSSPTVPVLISKDPLYNVDFVYGTSIYGNVVGSVNITSLSGGVANPVSRVLAPLVIAHPDDNNVTYSLGVALSEAQLVVRATSTPIPAPTATPVSSGSGAGPTSTPIPMPTSTPVSSGSGAGPTSTPVPMPTSTPIPPTPAPSGSTGGGGGYGGGSGCHVAGELITMANGSKKPVEDLKVGDVLLSLDINGLSDDETTHHNFNISVSDYSDKYIPTVIRSIKVDGYHKYHNINDGLLKITQEHPILIRTTDNRIMFKRAEHVSIGDSMLNENEEWVVVNSNELIETEPFTTWTLDVEDKDVYFANGISVHNAIDVIKDADDSNREILQ